MVKPQQFLTEQPREFIDDAIRYLNQGFKVAMLTLVNVEGSAPYPVGSQMLVRDDGEFVGQITGGCAETALVQQALMTISKSENTTERYGLNSRYFDIQLPCGSGLDIEFDVSTSLKDYLEIAKSLAQRQSVRKGAFKTYYPTPRILLFGQGPIMPSLMKLALLGGFDVMLFDLDEFYTAPISSYCDQYTALVSLFHEHELEFDILLQALESDLFYIGALGSQRTHSARLKTLAEHGVAKPILDRIYGPVGFDIGATTPTQIAVSVLAEVIAVMNQK